MRRLLSLRPWTAYAIYVFADLLCAALGMGVPVLCILLGLPVGWYVVCAAAQRSRNLEELLRPVLPAAIATAAFTFALMAGLWGHMLGLLNDPSADYVNTGVPMILFEPKASFVGWEVLMILISPALQLVVTVFGAHITLWWWLRRRGGSKGVLPGPEGAA